MRSRIIFLMCSFFLCHWAIAQDLNWDNHFSTIDSLIQKHYFDQAQVEVDDLFQDFNNITEASKYKTQLLELKFRQAVIYDRHNNQSTNALELLLEISDQANKGNLHSLSSRIYLLMALCYEKAGYWELTKKYLQLANEVITEHTLESVYSTYCIRKGSYHRFVDELDSMLYYANEAKKYAVKHQNYTDEVDSHILLGIGLSKVQNHDEALKYKSLLLAHHKKINNVLDISNVYNNISNIYLKKEDYSQALKYSDSAYVFYEHLPMTQTSSLAMIRSQIFERMNNIDSAYHYIKIYISQFNFIKNEELKLGIIKLEEQYQNEKKEEVISNKNRQMVLIACLLGVIVFGLILLIRKNRQINKQNKTISQHVIDLSKTLEQKQMLLSELQHRVKNNLQHVISILEIQKESVDFNNIDELIRGNQNRIHSMALLHKKLNVSDNVHEVDMKRYITELSELVKDSYDCQKKQITINIECEVSPVSIEKALPLGLIITELVSNSMKHAFKKRSVGVIQIEMTQVSTVYKLWYADNGDGFDFDKASEKGLGQEIIKGLIDQLDGKVIAKGDNGFELTVHFQ